MVYLELYFCVVYGSALISHCLIGAGFRDTVKIGSGCEPEKGETIGW